ncbi:malto-oligosyltrehalose synthase [Actinomadura algeriensis]|uniref:(1->4)-alpha-D-glucan 1-alpha-D-glucosylmutase n=1 Tax=Actinomadura algeriensis TaxID=1679523 RepID=A0ABR9JT39_9ACTN|nr:malto-oligosyltrehalose synthase [Actinomadura algeriensis]MBE1533736.1 (1->4)-alpha-D-glucan 1-alpha-D-glucosylmutase [Actinomadura algeriensis]
MPDLPPPESSPPEPSPRESSPPDHAPDPTEDDMAEEIPADGPAAPPSGTYRVQLRGTPEERFGFAEAAALAPYLAALGVSHVYLSPVLQAVPGSAHGYDVVDHSRLADELGGAEAFGAMATRFRAHGLRLLIDIVPNHMAIPDPPDRNAPLTAVLAEGRSSPFARWFDVDWDAGGGRLVPPGHGEPNYRRFFDISGLIGLRQEEREVFDTTHDLPLDLVDQGLVDGLRVDHPDGLADPRGYLRRLVARAPEAWLLVEKITEGAERLPSDWPCAGTTGYDSLSMIGGLFVDPDGEKPLTDLYTSLTGGPADFAEVERESRRYAAEHGLKPEVDRLTRVLHRIAGDRPGLRRALVELLVAMPVYRAYVVPGEDAPPQAVEVLEEAAGRARPRLSEDLHGDLDTIVDLALGRGEKTDPEFIIRFQQTTAPLSAKGVEDTAFYRWNRMAALNEVGGDPDRFSVDPVDFHTHCIRLARDWPQTMTTLSTHDTKRQEDVRAWLSVLSEVSDEWAEAVHRWRGWWGGAQSPLEPDLEYLLWQTLVGAWPLEPDRLTDFLAKAMREAKTRTSWLEPDAEYEGAVLDHVRRVLADPDLITDVTAFVSRLHPYARVNTLGQKLVQLAMPGVPDVYQGCEMTGLALVDPDNRRPVDYGLRREHLHRLDTGRRPKDVDDEKLLVTMRTLRLRRSRPDWFGPAAGYEPRAVRGPAAGHVVGFARGDALALATRLPVGLERRGGWAGTTIDAGRQGWHDVLSGAMHWGPDLDAAEVFAQLPVALLIPREVSR